LKQVMLRHEPAVADRKGIRMKALLDKQITTMEKPMSTHTNVVLEHTIRLGRRALPILVGLLALATPLVGQAKHGPFYHFNYYQVKPGAKKAYNSILAHCVTPVFDEMVKRKAIVSYLLLTKSAGSGEYTHITIVEVASPSSEGGFQRELEGASQAVFHRSWSDATTRLNELRRFLHTELYTPAGQEP